MDRRSTLKGVGGLISGSAIIGNVKADKPQNVSVSKFEKYCGKFSKKHGRKKKGKIMVKRRDGKVTDPHGVSKETNVSDIHNHQTLSKESPTAASKELIEYDDGTQIIQTVLDSEKYVFVDMGGKKFKLKRKQLKKVLQNRINKSKADLVQTSNNNTGNKKKEPATSDSQINESAGVSATASSISASSSGYTHRDFANWEGHTTATPIIAEANNDANFDGTTDHIETQAEGLGAGYGEAEVKAWDHWTLSGNHHEISVEFRGDYSATGLNGLGASEILLQCYLENDSGNVIQTSPAFRKNQFMVDFWTSSDSYTEGLYIRNYYGDSINIGFRSISVAAAAGSATAVVDAMDTPRDDHSGYFKLDDYYVNFRDK